MTDPEITFAEARARRELARRISHITSLQDPDSFANDFITWLRTERWNPPLQPPPDWRRTQPPDPDTAHAGAARARQALADTLEAERLSPTPPAPPRQETR